MEHKKVYGFVTDFSTDGKTVSIDITGEIDPQYIYANWYIRLLVIEFSKGYKNINFLRVSCESVKDEKNQPLPLGWGRLKPFARHVIVGSGGKEIEDQYKRKLTQNTTSLKFVLEELRNRANLGPFKLRFQIEIDAS